LAEQTRSARSPRAARTRRPTSHPSVYPPDAVERAGRDRAVGLEPGDQGGEIAAAGAPLGALAQHDEAVAPLGEEIVHRHAVAAVGIDRLAVEPHGRRIDAVADRARRIPGVGEVLRHVQDARVLLAEPLLLEQLPE